LPIFFYFCNSVGLNKILDPKNNTLKFYLIS
jgi:hypothetical protein